MKGEFKALKNERMAKLKGGLKGAKPQSALAAYASRKK